MPRVKRGVAAHAKHKKIFRQAKGFRGKRKNVFKLAKNAVMKAGMNAYRDRRLKKRSFHQLWVLRINAACREHDIRYSRFIYGCELAGIQINRKMLSELATNHPAAFKEVVERAKAVLPPEGEAPDLEALTKRLGKPGKSVTKTADEKPVKLEKAEEPKEKEL
jgi:large subunit ribosomal protein L20